jgi:hypothetical protein
LKRLVLHLQGTLHVGEAVEVLHLCLGAELGVTRATDGEVGIHPEGALLHAAVGDRGIEQELLERGEIRPRLRRAPHVGLAHDLGQGHAGAVQVHRGLARDAIVQ